MKKAIFFALLMVSANSFAEDAKTDECVKLTSKFIPSSLKEGVCVKKSKVEEAKHKFAAFLSKKLGVEKEVK